MKRVVALILIFSILFSLSAESVKHSSFGYTYESYSDDEFPIWVNEMRRAETLFFGSFVFTMPLSALAFSLAESGGLYHPASETQSALITIGTAAGASLLVSVIDWIIGRMSE